MNTHGFRNYVGPGPRKWHWPTHWRMDASARQEPSASVCKTDRDDIHRRRCEQRTTSRPGRSPGDGNASGFDSAAGVANREKARSFPDALDVVRENCRWLGNHRQNGPGRSPGAGNAAEGDSAAGVFTKQAHDFHIPYSLGGLHEPVDIPQCLARLCPLPNTQNISQNFAQYLIIAISRKKNPH